MTRPALRRPADTEQRATALELFYDLVFVWWSWNYTTWVTNELDPESPVVRLLMIGIMLASLLMSAALPEAFGAEAGLFVGAYLPIQGGRHAFLTGVAAGPRAPQRN